MLLKKGDTRGLRGRKRGMEYHRFENMLLADASHSCLTLGNMAFTFLMSSFECKS